MSMLRPPAPVLLLLALCWANASSAQMELRHESTEPGAIVMIGNALGLSANPTYDAPGTHGAIGVFTTVDTTQQVPGWPAGTTTDWRENSAAALLELDEYATILHAELVWSGSWDYPAGAIAPNELDSPVSFQTPAGAHAVMPDPLTSRTLEQQSAAGFRVRYYVRTADVTNLVRAGGAGEYIVSGVPGTIGPEGRELNAAGWTLVVAYGDPGDATRNLTVFVGGEWVDEGAALDTAVDGFCTPPSGAVEARLSLSAVEGDAHFTGDQFLIESPADGSFVALSGPNNPVSNFFGSQINGRDGNLVTTGTFGDLNHNAPGGTNVSGARQSWDITSVILSSALGHLTNAQTSTVLRGTSSSDGNNDSYVLVALGLEIDVNAPAFGFADNALFEIIPPDGGAPPRSERQVSVGDTLAFLYEIRNEGSADAESVTFHAVLPDTLAFVSGSFSFAGDDLTGVEAGDLVDGVELGPVPSIESDGEGLLVYFEAVVLDIPAPPAPDAFAVQPYWDYTWRSCPGAPPLQARTVAAPGRFGSAQLVLEKTALPEGPRAPGDVITWRLEITNTGSETSRFAALIDDAPPGTTYLPGTTTLDGALVPDVGGRMPFAEWGTLTGQGNDPGAIDPGQTVVVTFQSRIDDDASGPIRNTARVREADGDGAGDPVDGSADVDLVPGASTEPPIPSEPTDPGEPTSPTEPPETEEPVEPSESEETAPVPDPTGSGDGEGGTDADLPGSGVPGDGTVSAETSGCCAVASPTQQRSATFGSLLLLVGLLALRRREFRR